MQAVSHVDAVLWSSRVKQPPTCSFTQTLMLHRSYKAFALVQRGRGCNSISSATVRPCIPSARRRVLAAAHSHGNREANMQEFDASMRHGVAQARAQAATPHAIGAFMAAAFAVAALVARPYRHSAAPLASAHVAPAAPVAASPAASSATAQVGGGRAVLLASVSAAQASSPTAGLTQFGEMLVSQAYTCSCRSFLIWDEPHWCECGRTCSCTCRHQAYGLAETALDFHTCVVYTSGVRAVQSDASHDPAHLGQDPDRHG